MCLPCFLLAAWIKLFCWFWRLKKKMITRGNFSRKFSGRPMMRRTAFNSSSLISSSCPFSFSSSASNSSGGYLLRVKNFFLARGVPLPVVAARGGRERQGRAHGCRCRSHDVRRTSRSRDVRRTSRSSHGRRTSPRSPHGHRGCCPRGRVPGPLRDRALRRAVTPTKTTPFRIPD